MIIVQGFKVVSKKKKKKKKERKQHSGFYLEMQPFTS